MTCDEWLRILTAIGALVSGITGSIILIIQALKRRPGQETAKLVQDLHDQIVKPR